MRISKAIFLAALVLGFLVNSCSPEHVQPRGDDDLAAFNLDNGGFGQGGEHDPPAPLCGPQVSGLLKLQSGSFSFDLQGTSYLMVNGDTNMYVNIKGLPGWFFYETGCAILPVGGVPPVDANGDTDLGQYTFFEDHVANQTLQNKKTWRINMSCLEEVQTYSVGAVLGRWDFTTNTPIGTPFTVYINGKAISTGGFTVDYDMEACPGFCEPWINASNPCVPPCSVPVLGPGDDLSDYNCQGKSNKVTVCHFPPGNPANMQEICISTNALKAHIVDFKPANKPCMGHHSGCHIGPCDPCGLGTSQTSIDAALAFKTLHGCSGN